MGLKTLVIVNPKSRNGSTARTYPAFEPRLRDAIGDFDVEWTKARGDAERIAREAARAGVERILVAGGDGSAGEATTGILSAGLGDRTTLGVLPMGTGADLLRTVGVPRDIEVVLDHLKRETGRTVDAGRVVFRGRDGSERTRFFLNASTCGLGADVTRRVDESSKRLGGFVSFLSATLRSVAGYRARPASVWIDGDCCYEGPLLLACVMNGRFFGGGMHAAPDAEIDDGFFEVLVIPQVPLTKFLGEFPQIYRGRLKEVDVVRSGRGREIEVRCEPGAIEMEIDGEPLGGPPAHYEVLPGAIRLVGVPPA